MVKRPLINIYTLDWRMIELWIYRKLVKWKICKLPVTHKVIPKSARTINYEMSWMASVNRVPINFAHRDRFMEISGPVKIRNNGPNDITLEGPLLRIKIGSRDSVLIASPILEMIDFGGEKMIREWDALEVVNDVLAEYARSLRGGVPMSQAEALDFMREKFGIIHQRRELDGSQKLS
jgi:hypothetical protein